MLRWLATIALVAVAARPVSGQERKDTVLAAARESRQAAAAGLDTLRALAREHARGRDPFPLRLAEGFDSRGEELPRLAGAQEAATCSGSRPLALSLSIG